MTPPLQSLFVFFTCIVGLGLAAAIFKEKNPLFKIAIALPFGLSMIGLSVVLMVAFNLDVTTLSILIAGFFLIFASLYIFWKYEIQHSHGYKKSSWLTIVFTVFLSLYTLEQLSFSTLSFDSVKQVLYSQALAHHGQVLPEFSDVFASWGSILISYQTAATLLSIEFLYILPAAIYLSFLVLFYQSLPPIGLSHHFEKKVVIMLLSFGSFFVLWQFFYLHNNFPTALLLFVSLLTAQRVVDHIEWPQATGFLIIALGFCFSRTETSIFAALFIGAVFSQQKANRLRAWLITILAIVIIGWYMRLLGMIGGGTDILTPTRIPVVTGPMVLLALFQWARLQYTSVDKKAHLFPLVALVAASLVTLILAFLKPDHMIKSMQSLVRNYSLFWGYGWYLLVPLLILSLKMQGKRAMVLAILCYFIAMIGLSYFRPPFRIGWGDSGNRISLNFYILGWYCVAHNLSAIQQLAIDFLNRKNRLITSKSSL